jgi:aldehyde dehydrogenase (NAD+)
MALSVGDLIPGFLPRVSWHTDSVPASVYTKDMDRAFRMAAAIESGGVAINGLFIPSNQTPFGGFKQSGVGKELGKYGLMEYMKTKSVHIK